jgi:hypothetical protein
MKSSRLWALGIVSFVIIFGPTLMMTVVGFTGADVESGTVNLGFGLLGLVLAAAFFLSAWRIPTRVWLSWHHLPKDEEALNAIAASKRKWRTSHPLLFLTSQRFAIRRADGAKEGFPAAAWVAEAYGDAGGADIFELFELLRAFQHQGGGWMNTTDCAIAKVVGMKHIVGALRSGTDVHTMVFYIQKFGVSYLEKGLEAGVPLEYMEAMR